MRPRLREKLWPLGLGALVLLGCLWATQTQFGPVRAAVQGAENFVYDQRLILTQPPEPEPDDRVIIVDIDERSLGEIGRWPWPRAVVADLVDRLWEAGVVVVGFDVVFAEPERNIIGEVAGALDDPEILEQLEELAPYFDGDSRLADSLAMGDAVLGYIFHSDEADTHTGVLPPPHRNRLKDGDGRPLAVHRLPQFTGNRRELQEAALAAGFFTVRPDDDGVVRRLPLVLGHDNELYASLPLEVVRLYQLLDDFELRTEPMGRAAAIEEVELGQMRIPTDAHGQALVPYLGPSRTFPYVSAADVLEGRIDPDRLEGAIVLVGTSALGLFDLRTVPGDSVFPGVEIHASMVSAMLDGSFPHRPSWADAADLLMVALLGLALVLLLPFLSPVWALVTAGVTLAGFSGWNLWLWQSEQLVLGYAPVAFTVAAITVLNLGWGFLFEHRRRNILRRRFGEYVPPELVDEMAERPDAYGFEGESREITILFADIRGFTTLSETLDAGDLKNLLNRFFTPMTRVIFDSRGTIDKYVGDMIMAFWGAPVDDPDHRRHAIEAGFGMLREVDRLREVFTAEGLPAIDIGIGLNSGYASVGDMGSEYRRAYTALGDSVNLASRVEAATKTYGVRFMVAEHTCEGLAEEYVFRELDRVRVKGRHEPVTLYEPVGRRDAVDEATRAFVERQHAALEHFRARAWDPAEAAFRELLAERPGDACLELYLERIAELRDDDPGPGWDGVFTRKEK